MRQLLERRRSGTAHALFRRHRFGRCQRRQNEPQHEDPSLSSNLVGLAQLDASAEIERAR